MVMCLVHNMFFCSKMRIYIITHINFIFFLPIHSNKLTAVSI